MVGKGNERTKNTKLLHKKEKDDSFMNELPPILMRDETPVKMCCCRLTMAHDESLKFIIMGEGRTPIFLNNELTEGSLLVDKSEIHEKLNFRKENSMYFYGRKKE